jgi:DnaJ like chaperone protein
MAWWGTLLGGTLGYMFGGPLGAILGAALGGNFDRGINVTSQFDPGAQERVQAAFFTATFSVMGHVAKADGKVTPEEIALANTIMDQMQLSHDQRKTAKKLFQEGKDASFPVDDVLIQFRQECHRRLNLIQIFLEIQISIAMSDGQLHRNEKGVIFHIGQLLGFDHNHIENLFRFTAGAAGSHDNKKQSTYDAYAILGVSKSASKAEIKKAYRRLMNQHHPDKLVAKGLPEEMIKIATEKTQEIRKAYDLIKDRNINH